MVHAHVTTWFVAIILLFVSFFMYKSGKQKAAKVTKYILRLFYLLILATGGHLLSIYAVNMDAGIMSSPVIYKTLAGIWAIASMEIILNVQAKGKSTEISWFQFVISITIAIFMGYFVLPM